MKKSDPGIELVEATSLVSAVPCGVVSITLAAPAGVEASIKLYNVAAVGDIVTVIKTLLVGGTADIAATIVYCPCKSDSFGVGCVAVVAGTGALASVSIES